jgi:hypothetical protein
MDEFPEAQQNAAGEWIDSKWRNGGDTPCPMCGENFWVIFEPVAMPDPQDPSRKSTPFVPVTCRNCAATQFLPVLAGFGYPGLAADKLPPGYVVTDTTDE